VCVFEHVRMCVCTGLFLGVNVFVFVCEHTRKSHTAIIEIGQVMKPVTHTRSSEKEGMTD